MVGIEEKPPELFNYDPTPLLFHARERGDQPLCDNSEARKKGWKRIVLFASFLRPEKLSIPSLVKVFKNSFKSGVRNPRAHFGIFPYSWHKDRENSSKELVKSVGPLIQIAPVLERLVLKDLYQKFLSKEFF